MQNLIKNALDELNCNNPNWDMEVLEYLENDKGEGKESFNKLTEILLQIVNKIRDQKMTKDDLKHILSDYQQYKSFDYIFRYIWNKISIYADYSLLRDMCQSDKYMAQRIVDIIWDEHIYRFNPYMIWTEKIKIDDDSIYKNLAIRLNKYVIRSVRYSLTYDAMVESLKTDSELSDEICRYIAKKIDENMKELKINYILDRLIRLDDRVKSSLLNEPTED